MRERPLTPFQEAAERLRQRGVRLTTAPGEYVVNFRKGRPATEYRTGELADALAYGLRLGPGPVELPPLGPLGKGKGSRHARIYAHNRRLAARRRKAGR